MPKSQVKMQAVKDRIFHAAMELFEQKGYENTSVEEITKKAGVSKGTFFTHFTTKDAVFSAIGKIFVEYLQDIVETGLRENRTAQQILIESIHMAADWCMENKPYIRQVLSSGMYHPAMGSRSTTNRVAMTELLGRVLKEGQKQGEICSSLSVEVGSAVLTGTYFTIMYDWINEGCIWPLEDKLTDCVELLYRGLHP